MLVKIVVKRIVVVETYREEMAYSAVIRKLSTKPVARDGVVVVVFLQHLPKREYGLLVQVKQVWLIIMKRHLVVGVSVGGSEIYTHNRSYVNASSYEVNELVVSLLGETAYSKIHIAYLLPVILQSLLHSAVCNLSKHKELCGSC